MLFSPLIERLSYRTHDFSMTDLHNALKQGKAIGPAGISEDGRFLLKEPSNIDGLYEKLSSAPKNAITEDGSDDFIDNKSYMLHRTGTIKPDQCPKLAIISTSSAFLKNSQTSLKSYMTKRTYYR